VAVCLQSCARHLVSWSTERPSCSDGIASHQHGLLHDKCGAISDIGLGSTTAVHVHVSGVQLAELCDSSCWPAFADPTCLHLVERLQDTLWIDALTPCRVLQLHVPRLVLCRRMHITPCIKFIHPAWMGANRLGLYVGPAHKACGCGF
jgi:hypothetical protein